MTIRHLKRKLEGQAGLTLVEVIVALAILSISLLTIITMFQYNYVSGIEDLRQTIAVNLARQGIESCREAVLTPDDWNEEIEINGSGGTKYERHFTVTYDTASKMYDVKVKVTWDSFFGKDKSVEFELKKF